MFAAKKNKLDLFEAMNKGSLILINTAKDFLNQDGCEIFGRFFLALISQAAQERARLTAKIRKDTFLYIDEAHDYFDENMEHMINQLRKRQVGCILAHQNLGQLNRKLEDTIMASTAIKMVGGISEKDARAFATGNAMQP